MSLIESRHAGWDTQGMETLDRPLPISVEEAEQRLQDFTPTQPCEWTRWDHFVHSTTGRVSRRVYEDRMNCVWRDESELRMLALDLQMAQKLLGS